MKDTKTALIWITGILKKHQIPFQISGGLAAIAYGASQLEHFLNPRYPRNVYKKYFENRRDHAR